MGYGDGFRPLGNDYNLRTRPRYRSATRTHTHTHTFARKHIYALTWMLTGFKVWAKNGGGRTRLERERDREERRRELSIRNRLPWRPFSNESSAAQPPLPRISPSATVAARGKRVFRVRNAIAEARIAIRDFGVRKKNRRKTDRMFAKRFWWLQNLFGIRTTDPVVSLRLRTRVRELRPALFFS